MGSGRPRSVSNPWGGYTTSSPLFYSIPWNPLDYSSSGLGPGQSAVTDRYNQSGLANVPQYNHTDGRGRDGELNYSKAGFTYFNSKKCICGFLSEYRKEFNRGTFQSAHANHKPWWNGRELTSKFDPKFPCYPMHIDGISTYAKDYRGVGGRAADLCYPEGEIERAERILGPTPTDTRLLCHYHDQGHHQNHGPDLWAPRPAIHY